jgi:hypothetical protein
MAKITAMLPSRAPGKRRPAFRRRQVMDALGMAITEKLGLCPHFTARD